MKAFSEWSPRNNPQCDVAAFDLDDTLTDQGALPSAVLAALERAQSRGWRTVLVTGRPAGWADALVKLLPFDAIVSENGAVIHAWKKSKSARGAREEPLKLYWSRGSRYAASVPSGVKKFRTLAQKRILRLHPAAKLASDQPYRLYDLAIDFAEEVDPPLGLIDAQAIARSFAALGATAKVSSIHVNGWRGKFSKEMGLRRLLKEWRRGVPETRVVYVGDSPNDESLFKIAAVSVGVANLRDFLGRVPFYAPAYVTRRSRSQGALEVLRVLGR